MRVICTLLLACTMLFTWAQPANADPISLSALVAGFKAFTATKFGAFLFNAALSAGLSLLSQWVARRRQRKSGMKIGGTSTGEEVSQEFPVGRVPVEGHLVYHNSHKGDRKTPNSYYTMVVEVSDLPRTALRRLIINDRAVNITDTVHSTYGNMIAGLGKQNRAWIKYYDGTQIAADPGLVATYGNDPHHPYGPDRIGTGTAYAILTFRLDREVFSGAPRLGFVLESAPLYDPREDSTVGGDGPQRGDDPSTWQPSDNPAVQEYNILRGIPMPCGSIYGGGGGEIPLANAVAAMNTCDEIMPNGRPRFVTGMAIRVADDEPASVMEELLGGSVGQISEMGGVWRLRHGAPAAPVMSITDDDISISDQQALDPIKGLEATHNGIRGTVLSPGDLWQPVDLPPIYNAEWEARDGGRRLVADVRLSAVYRRAQGRRVLRAYIRDEQRQRQHRFVLPPDALSLNLLDTIEWTSGRNGYQDKIFELLSVVHRSLSGMVEVVLRERDPSDYDWVPADDLPDAPDMDPLEPAPVQGVPGFAVTAAAVKDGGNNDRRPAIKLTWDTGWDDVDVLRWQLRLTATGEIVGEGLAPVEDGGHTIAEGILPAESYESRAQLVVPGRAVEWTDWLGATTPDLPITRDDVAPDLREEFDAARDLIDGTIENIEGVIGDLRERIGEIIAPIVGPGLPTVPHIERLTQEIAAEVSQRADDILATAGNIRRERDRIRRVAQELMEAAAHGEGERAEIRRDLSVELNAARAAFSESITLLASQEAALAQQVTQLVAEANELAAEILRVDTARIDGENALASQIALLSVGSAVQFDHVSIWYWDDTAEGWTGSPDAPTVSGDGWLVPAAGSHVVSPAGLAVDSAAYRQVRARVRNEPGTWSDAYLYWAAEGQGWDIARRVAIDAPVWDNDEAPVTINPDWSGVIDRIRVDLPDGVEIDWLAVGRPAPGVSSADIAAERQARISADEALASDILALTAELSDAEGLITANADALQQLAARVTETEDGIESLAQAQTAIQSEITDLETGQSALSQAVDNLETLTVDIEDALRTQSTATRAVRSSAALRNSELLEALAQALGRDNDVREVVATATQDLRTLIEITDDELRIVAEAVTQLQAAIPGLATADALQLLATRVVANEDGLEVIAAAQTLLSSRIGDAENDIGSIEANLVQNYYTAAQTDGEISTAVAAAELALNSRIDGAEENLTDLEANLALNYWTQTETTGEINTAVAGLKSEINAQIVDLESGLDAQGTAIDGLVTSVQVIDGQVEVLTASRRLLEASIRAANMVPNGEFPNGDLTEWETLGAFDTVARDSEASITAIATAPTPHVMRLPQSGAAQTATPVVRSAVEEGEQFRASLSYATSGADPRSVSLSVRVTWYDAADSQIGTALSILGIAAASNVEWVRAVGEIASAPAGAVAMRIQLRREAGGSGIGYVTNIRVERRSADQVEAAARIDTIEATRVTEEQVEAIIDTQVQASFDAAGLGEITSMAAFSIWAVANADGSNSGFRFALDGDDVLSAIRVREDGEDPTTIIRLAGDYILLNGNTAIAGDFLVEGNHVQLSADTTISGYLGSQTFDFNSGWRIYPDGFALFRNVTVDGGAIRSGNFSAGSAGWQIQGDGDVEINSGTIRATLQSGNYSAGASGWSIQQNGNAEFNQLTLREGIIGRDELDSGAATDIISESTVGEVEHNDDGWETIHQIELGENPIRDIWIVHASCSIRTQNVTNGRYRGRFRVQRRLQRMNDLFTSWATVSSDLIAAPTATQWSFVNFSDIIGGRLQDIQYRIQAAVAEGIDDPQQPLGPRTANLHRDPVISAERRAR